MAKEPSAYAADEQMKENLWQEFDLAIADGDLEDARKVMMNAQSLGYDDVVIEMKDELNS